MKNKSLLRALIIPYIAVMIFWNYRVYVNYSGIWNYLYVWDVWDTIRYTFIDIIVIEVISLAVRYAEKHIIKYGETRDIFVDDVTEIIRGIYKWINKGFNLLFGIIGIVAIVKIVNSESNYGIIREFLINIRPVLLWMPIQEIVKSICNLFADKIDEDEVEKEKNEEAIEEKSKIELQNEQTEEYDSKKENACDEEKNDADIMESEEKIQELSEKKSNSTAIAVGVFIVGVLVLIGALLMRSCAGNSSSDNVAGNSTSGVESATETEEYTLEEYLSNCIVVDTETIGRNPNKYIGKDVLIEDKFTLIGSTLSVGFARTTYPIKVEYDGAAYDLELNSIGNVLSGDFGFVAGKCVSEDCIHAEIIVLYEEGKGSYEQLINSNVISGQESKKVNEKPPLKQEGTNSVTQKENPEWTTKIVTNREPGNVSSEYNGFSTGDAWYINFVFKCNVSTELASASYEISSSGGTVYTGSIDGMVKDGDVWTLEVPSYTFEEGEDVFITLFINDKESSSTSVWMTYY